MKKEAIGGMDGKVGAHHLSRRAVVYVRQSSERQVKQNLESQRLQYGLAEWVRRAGWSDIEVIDRDLGSSAAVGAPERERFDRLIGAVAQGEVGIILCREVSRLLRSDKDWCRVFEVCSLFETLVGDGERVYDLNLMDDQMVLGIKGTLSVVELKVLNMRLRAGLEAKARRGELERTLPSGYVRDGDGRIVKHPDCRVREAMALVFRKFRELGSVRQTYLWFLREGVELPVNKAGGGVIRLVWPLPTNAFIKDVLTNPMYTGAYVWGRRQTRKVVEGGRVQKRQSGFVRPEEWTAHIPNHHEGYIEWETYEENTRLIGKNCGRREGHEAVMAARSGQGLLSGLLRCGRCGRKLSVRYQGREGTQGRYLCKGEFDSGGAYCIGFGCGMVDRHFSAELLKVISPLGMKASLAALEALRGGERDQDKALARQLEQAEYEALRAFEQYDQVDARNRLVADELERRWNAKLEQVNALKAARTRHAEQSPGVTGEERQQILDLGSSFADAWNHKDCPVVLKKKWVRCVVEEVVADEQDGKLTFVIHWKGGAHTRCQMKRMATPAGRKTSDEDVEVMRKMAVRYGDDEIARVLNKLGRRTGMGRRWNMERVARARRLHSIPGRSRTQADAELLTLHTAAKHCGVSMSTIKRLVPARILVKEQVAPWAPLEIRRCDLDRDPVLGIVRRLQRTGKLVLSSSDDSPGLFEEELADGEG